MNESVKWTNWMVKFLCVQAQSPSLYYSMNCEPLDLAVYRRNEKYIDFGIGGPRHQPGLESFWRIFFFFRGWLRCLQFGEAERGRPAGLVVVGPLKLPDLPHDDDDEGDMESAMSDTRNNIVGASHQF